MEQLLKLKERVDIALEIGESHYREFKSAFEGPVKNKKPRELKEVCEDAARTLVAFANADGGELFVGIEDDNSISGLMYSDEKITQLLKSHESNVLKDTPLPVKKVSLIDYMESVSKNIKKTMSPEKLLQYLELAEFDGNRLKLRRAALLLFAKNISKWHPRSQVRILKANGKRNNRCWRVKYSVYNVT
jgi:predicted HTH transcriptional regulator